MIDFQKQHAAVKRYLRDLLAQAPRDRQHQRIDLSAFSDEDLTTARLNWAGRLVDEYRAVVVFSDLLKLLLESEAPFEAAIVVQRVIGDEMRHVQLCASALNMLDGTDKVDLDLGNLQLPEWNGDPMLRAYEIVVREILVAETESVGVLHVFRNACEEPALVQIFDILLADEARHAAAGRQLSRMLMEHFGAQRLLAGNSLAQRVESDIVLIRATYAAGARGGPARALGASLLPGDLPRAVSYARERWLWDSQLAQTGS